VKRAVDEIRTGQSGPRFFEVSCYRWKEHVGPGEDFHAGYRSRDEAQPWYDADPLRRLADELTLAQRDTIEREVEAEIEAAIRFAEESPFPEEHELTTDLYRD
jgi:TPP-dependent pyruvate/acetoin dehydrogenase alpha subunit